MKFTLLWRDIQEFCFNNIFVILNMVFLLRTKLKNKEKNLFSKIILCFLRKYPGISYKSIYLYLYIVYIYIYFAYLLWCLKGPQGRIMDYRIFKNLLLINSILKILKIHKRKKTAKFFVCFCFAMFTKRKYCSQLKRPSLYMYQRN